MAGRGRDMILRILGEVDGFQDAEKAGTQLEGLADAADDVSDATGKLERDLKATGGDLDRLGKDADATARDVDNAFDKIARSGKSLRKVDADASKARQGLDEMGNEAQSTAKEAAASFSDVESGLDAVQEIAANAFAGFGPAGLAAGAAAAAGMGVLFSSLQKSTDEANATKDRIIELSGAISDAGGVVDAVDVEGRLREWSREVADNKSWWEFWQESNTTNLEKFEESSRKAGLSIDKLFENSGDPEAVARNLRAMNDALAENRRRQDEAADAYDRNVDGASRLIVKYAEERKGLEERKDAYLASAGATEEAIELAAKEAAAFGLTAGARQEATEAIEAHAAALDGFTDPVSVYTELLAAKSAAEKDGAKNTEVTVDEYLGSLEKQVKAQEKWANNLQTLAKRGVDEGVLAELERMGPEGAPLVAKLTKASDKELVKLVSLMGRQGSAAGQSVASNLAAKAPAMGAAAVKVRQAAAIELSKNITVPVTLSDVSREAQLAWLEADAYFRRNPITIRTRGTTGARPVRDVP